MSTTTKNETKAYQRLRDIAEAHGYRMSFERKGYRFGAWIVERGETRKVFRSNSSGYPELDELYVPKIARPQHYLDYTHQLVPGAESKFLRLVEQPDSWPRM